MSITYELALKLKEAGFPIFTFRELDLPVNGILYKRELVSPNGKTEALLVPTLSELIKACYNDTFKLYREKGLWIAFKNNIVGVEEKGNIIAHEFWAEGLSPEEAVGNLYIVINKK